MASARYSEDLVAVFAECRDGKSLREIAQASGLDVGTVLQVVNRGRVPQYDTLARLADGLGVKGGKRRELFAAAGYVELRKEPVPA
jgi:transcriptional regulator with XRE-family HTH domain